MESGEGVRAKCSGQSHEVRGMKCGRSLLGLAAVFWALGSGPAWAARDVREYRPFRVCPGGAVALIGSGFGDTQIPGETVVVGQGGAARGPVSRVTRWSAAEIDVVLPGAIPAGTYWLKVYQDGAPSGRAPETLAVRADCAPPAGVSLPPGNREALEKPFRPAGRGFAGTGRPLPASGAPRYAVTVAVTQIRSYDDCDNLSPGDWVLYFAAKGADPGGREVKQDKIWPSSRGTSQDVDTGRVVPIGWSADLGELAGDRNLVLVTAGVDCDSGGGLRPRWFVEISGVDRGCGGEEDIERSTDHDSLGTLEITLTPAQWTRGGTFEGDTHGGGDCGLHTWFDVTATRR